MRRRIMMVLPRGGLNSATRCLEGTVEGSQRVAWYRPLSLLVALTKAGCGLASPGGCGRWLPVWLPGLVLFTRLT